MAFAWLDDRETPRAGSRHHSYEERNDRQERSNSLTGLGGRALRRAEVTLHVDDEQGGPGSLEREDAVIATGDADHAADPWRTAATAATTSRRTRANSGLSFCSDSRGRGRGTRISEAM